MIGWFGFVIVALAAYRATRIFTRDSLTATWREWLYRWAWDDSKPQKHLDRDTGDEYMVATARSSWRSYAHELLTCTWCLGVWVSAVLYCAYRWGGDEIVRPGLFVLALAGVQGFLASRSDA